MAVTDIRDEETIGDDCLNVILAQTRLTDVSRIASVSQFSRGVVGPEIAGLFSALLARMEGFYFHTASGDDLRRRLADFGLEWPAARKATFDLTVKRAPGVVGAITIPEGTRISALDPDGNELLYATVAEATMAAVDNFLSVFSEAAATGTRYNVGAGAITTLVDAIPGLPPNGLDPSLPGVSVTNLLAVVDGLDEGTDEDARAVFFDWLLMKDGTTPEAARLAAVTYEETGSDGRKRRPVASAQVLEYLNEPGPDNLAMRIYVIGPGGKVITAAQHEAIRRRINGYVDANGRNIRGFRAPGCLHTTDDPVLIAVEIDVVLTLTEKGSEATIERLRRDLAVKIGALPIGASVPLKLIYDAVIALGDEVENMRINAPAGDIPIGFGQKAVLSRLSVTGG